MGKGHRRSALNAVSCQPFSLHRFPPAITMNSLSDQKEQPLSSADIQGLLDLATTPYDSRTRSLAARILCKLNLDHEALGLAARSILEVLRDTYDSPEADPELLADAMQCPAAPVRAAVRNIALRRNAICSFPAAQALAFAGDDTGVEVLLMHLPSEERKLPAIKALTCVPEPILLSHSHALLNLSEDPDPDVRLWASIASARCGKIGPFKKAWRDLRRQSLRPSLFNGDPEVARAELRVIPSPNREFRSALKKLHAPRKPFFRWPWKSAQYVPSTQDERITSLLYECFTERSEPPVTESTPGNDPESVAADASELLDAAMRVSRSIREHPGEYLSRHRIPRHELTCLRALPEQETQALLASVLSTLSLDEFNHPGRATVLGNSIVTIASYLPRPLPIHIVLSSVDLLGDRPLPVAEPHLSWMLAQGGTKNLVRELSGVAAVAPLPNDRARALNWLRLACESTSSHPPMLGAGGHVATPKAAVQLTEVVIPGWEFSDLGALAPDPKNVDGAAGTPPSPRTSEQHVPEAALPQRLERSTRTAWPHLDAPSIAVIGVPFTVELGLRPTQDARIQGATRLVVPVGDFALEYALSVHRSSFELVEGERSGILKVTKETPFPRVRLTLRAIAGAELSDTRRIGVIFSAEGTFRGYSYLDIQVASPDRSTTSVGEQPPTDGGAVDTGKAIQDEDPDLSIFIRKGDHLGGGALLFRATSPHKLNGLPGLEGECDIGMKPEAFMKSIVEQVKNTDSGTQLLDHLIGKGIQVRRHLPDVIVDALRQVSLATAPRVATVFILTEDPYVPWEFAVLEKNRPNDVAPFLGAQFTVSRWALPRKQTPPRPPVSVTIADGAVFTAVYEGIPYYAPLQHAVQEAQDLCTRWPGTQPVAATYDAVSRWIKGEEGADVLHFALHGKLDCTGMGSCLVLLEGSQDGKYRAVPLHAAQVLSGNLEERTPFVFLNACQTATSGEVLGDYAGLAVAFIEAGASAVVSPLWAIDDAVARQIALTFYEQAVDKSQPVAEALRQTRAKISSVTAQQMGAQQVLSCLAYQYLGHPRFRLLVHHPLSAATHP